MSVPTTIYFVLILIFGSTVTICKTVFESAVLNATCQLEFSDVSLPTNQFSIVMFVIITRGRLLVVNKSRKVFDGLQTKEIYLSSFRLDVKKQIWYFVSFFVIHLIFSISFLWRASDVVWEKLLSPMEKKKLKEIEFFCWQCGRFTLRCIYTFSKICLPMSFAMLRHILMLVFCLTDLKNRWNSFEC